MSHLVEQLRELALDAGDPDARDEDRLMREAANRIDALEPLDALAMLAPSMARRAASATVDDMVLREWFEALGRVSATASGVLPDIASLDGKDVKSGNSQNTDAKTMISIETVMFKAEAEVVESARELLEQLDLIYGAGFGNEALHPLVTDLSEAIVRLDSVAADIGNEAGSADTTEAFKRRTDALVGDTAWRRRHVEPPFGDR